MYWTLIRNDIKASQTKHVLFMKDGKIEDELKFDLMEYQHQELRISRITKMMERIGI